jgi:hypothetical protein
MFPDSIIPLIIDLDPGTPSEEGAPAEKYSNQLAFNSLITAHPDLDSDKNWIPALPPKDEWAVIHTDMRQS